MALGHLLQDLDEEADLHLCRLLQESVQRRGPLRLAQHTEPLLNGAQFVLKVLIQSSRGHVLERRLILLDIRHPLLGHLFSSLVGVARAGGLVVLVDIDFGGGTDATSSEG